jgi:hypothetical protein
VTFNKLEKDVPSGQMWSHGQPVSNQGTFLQIRKNPSLPMVGAILYQDKHLDFFLPPFDLVL